VTLPCVFCLLLISYGEAVNTSKSQLQQLRRSKTKILDAYNYGYTNFPKILELPKNSRCQKDASCTLRNHKYFFTVVQNLAPWSTWCTEFVHVCISYISEYHIYPNMGQEVFPNLSSLLTFILIMWAIHYIYSSSYTFGANWCIKSPAHHAAIACLNAHLCVLLTCFALKKCCLVAGFEFYVFAFTFMHEPFSYFNAIHFKYCFINSCYRILHQVWLLQQWSLLYLATYLDQWLVPMIMKVRQ